MALRNLKIIAISTFLSMLVFSSAVLAIPIPHQFYGTVTLNGGPAPDGSTVVAKIDGVEVASTTTSEGKYGYQPDILIVEGSSYDAGKTIYFFVNGNQANENYQFCYEFVCTTELNLTATQASPPSPTPPAASGGGAGGGGGGAPVQVCELNGICDSGETYESCPSDCPEETATTTSGAGETECQESWVCGGWKRCVDGLKKRTCMDENNCGTEIDKPFISEPCSAEEIAGAGPSVLGFLTGMAVALTENSIYIILLLGSALVVLVVIKKKYFQKLVKTKKKKAKRKK